MVLCTEKCKPIWNHTDHKTSNMKLDTLYHKSVIMWTVRSKYKVNKSDNLVQSRPKRDIKPPFKLDL